MSIKAEHEEEKLASLLLAFLQNCTEFESEPSRDTALGLSITTLRRKANRQGLRV